MYVIPTHRDRSDDFRTSDFDPVWYMQRACAMYVFETRPFTCAALQRTNDVVHVVGADTGAGCHPLLHRIQAFGVLQS